MIKSKASWFVQDINDQITEDIQKKTGLSPIAARFLAQRGITEAGEIQHFLHAGREQLNDPFLLKGMRQAVDRIHQAIEAGEKILVFGDYDADGVTSTTVLYQTLMELGAEVGWYVPNRFSEGYGPNDAAFQHAAEEGVRVIVTVDTGISAWNEAQTAASLGMDLIITDHHEPPPEIPPAFAVINPKQEGCTYPFNELAGVGVSFKLSEALLGRFPEEHLDLAAAGTIADLVPLRGENRILAAEGLHALRRTKRVGIQALLTQAGKEQSEIDEETVGFLIGPRLNAAGRLDSADPAVELLLTDDPAEAEEIAIMIDELNRERQDIVKVITEEAVEVVEAQGVPSVLVVAGEGWNPGVIGIAASRLVELYYRPTIVLSLMEDGTAKGSARSIEGFDMFRSLSTARDILPRFGGHPMAAGLTMQQEDIEDLRSRLIHLAEETMRPEDWVKKLHVDLPVTVEEISVAAIQDLAQMAPFGIENPAPKVLLNQVVLEQAKKIGAGQDHLKMTLASGDHNTALDAIAFRMGDIYDQLSSTAPVSVVGKLSINEWNGRVKPQLIVEDLQVTEWQLFDFRGDKTIWRQEQARTLIYFQTIPTDIPDTWRVVHSEEVDGADVRHALLFDLPETMDQLGELMQSLTDLERLDTVFYHKEDYFFASLPNRDQFKWFYAMLKKRGSFNLKEHKKALADHKGWSEKTISLICQVFFELEFVKMDDGVVTLHPEPASRKLEEAPTYQKHSQKSRIQQELCYSPLKELKQQLEQYRIAARSASVEAGT
ncbi:single-stranded-DNA-specific exonuclease RecJ [Alkalicoccus chagannorensis]|uniref:single-stranded-DNA-specific exonuclease RecJ n=1 Tax=Alkalicoccus chagannorensis TaxID=427072 RepID=UPI00040DFCA4|nr:single-stranded-DNA-specific exonuclease RecJ [Alkalicoccus chagannorensis]